MRQHHAFPRWEWRGPAHWSGFVRWKARRIRALIELEPLEEMHLHPPRFQVAICYEPGSGPSQIGWEENWSALRRGVRQWTRSSSYTNGPMLRRVWMERDSEDGSMCLQHLRASTFGDSGCACREWWRWFARQLMRWRVLSLNLVVVRSRRRVFR